MGAEPEGLRSRGEEKIVGCPEKSPTYDFIQCWVRQSGTGQIKHYQNTAVCFTCTLNASEQAVSFQMIHLKPQ